MIQLGSLSMIYYPKKGDRRHRMVNASEAFMASI